MEIPIQLPAHLSEKRALGLSSSRQIIAQYELGEMQNLVYLVLDEVTRTAAIVDPQMDVDTPLSDLAKFGFKLTHILLTHTHFDHIAGLGELVRRDPELSIFLHAGDQSRLKSYGSLRLVLVEDQQKIALGQISIQALHTPGHSAGELCYFLAETTPPYLLTGDTVFIGDCGRTDLPTGDSQQMFESLQKIRKLPAPTVILPGHHYRAQVASTLGHELKTSAPFQCKTVAELEKLP